MKKFEFIQTRILNITIIELVFFVFSFSIITIVKTNNVTAQPDDFNTTKSNSSELNCVTSVGGYQVSQYSKASGESFISVISNVVTIPAGSGPYTTLNAAVAAINAGGVYSGVAVTITIKGIHTLTSALTINSGTFTSCLIKPSGVVNVNANLPSALLILNSSSNITIDGLNSGGNSLTFNNSSISTSAGSISMRNGSSNNIIRNCTCFGVGVSNLQGGFTINIAQSVTAIGNNNNIIENNLIIGGRRGIQVFGTAGLVTDTGTIIRNNIVKNTSSLAIFIGSETRNTTVHANEIFMDAAVSVGAGLNFRGINCQGVGTNVISNNRIHDLVSTDITATYFGILLIPVTLTAPGSNVTNLNVYNNSIILIAPNDGLVIGMSVSDISQPYTANVYYNTIRLAGSTSVSVVGQFDAALVSYNTQVGSVLNIKNNIAINGRMGGDALSLHIGYDLTIYPATGVTLNSDYNLTKGVDSSAWDGGYNGYVYRNAGIDEYKDSTCSASIEQHTMFRNVNFVSTDDCLLGLVGGDMDGTPLGAIATDIDGQTRNATHPYKGCDEKTTALKVITLGLSLESKVSDGQVKLILKNSSCEKIDSSTQDIHIAGLSGAFCFGDGTPSSSYFLDVSSINHIETYSADVVPFTGSTSYNFTTSVSQAFGNNQAPGPPVSFFGGDKNQDGLIDLTDIVEIYNDCAVFLSGCRLSSDINSDGTVDLTDLIIAFNNSRSFVSVITPCSKKAPEPASEVKMVNVQRKVNRIEKNKSLELGF